MRLLLQYICLILIVIGIIKIEIYFFYKWRKTLEDLAEAKRLFKEAEERLKKYLK